MNNVNSISWEEIYDYWNLYSMYGPSILKSSISPLELYVEFNEQDCTFYGYDWLTLEDYKSVKAILEKNVTQFLLFNKPTNKGTIHTLNMLIDSISDEERAAIWIYAFAKEMSDLHYQNNIGRYIHQLCHASWSFLSQHFYMWHHAMRKLVPEIFINYNFYSETEFNSIEPVIELARLNAALVLHEYVPILYTSLKPGQVAPDISLRRT